MTLAVPAWLQSQVDRAWLSEESLDYLYRRGAKAETLTALRAFTFQAEEPTDPALKIGRNGERVHNMICFPVFSTTGALLGFEARSPNDDKVIVKVYLPRAAWHPLWIAPPGVAEHAFAGGNLWIVEGVFDAFALSWCITDPILVSSRAFLTARHITYLERFVNGGIVRIAYDNDATGQQGLHGDSTSKGAVAKLRQRGIRVEAVRYTGGKDPGEIWSNGGAAAVLQAFSKWC